MRLTQDIIRKLIKEEVQKRMSSTELTEKAEALLSQLTSLDKNDAIKVVGMLRSQVAKLPTSRDAEADSFAQSPTNRDDELDEVYSEKQRRWACAQAGESRKNFKGTPSLTAAEAEEMCGAEIEKK